ncbi:MAG: hypothetical protein VX340_09305 [Pseudomonadota bacterium]|nr:hypothetical protein [Pseudomonadota bacterium]
MLETLEGDTVATVVIAFLVAGIFKGALGMGLPKISVAIMVVALGLCEATPVLMIPLFLANLWQGTRPGPVMPLFKRFRHDESGCLYRHLIGDDLFASHRHRDHQ